MNIGNAIRLCRNQRGLTLSELAKICGFSVSYLSMLEKGKRDPSISTVQSIASALSVPMNILVFLGSDSSELEGMSIELTEKLSHTALSLIGSFKANPDVLHA